MSLYRLYNRDLILQNNQPRYGKVFSDVVLDRTPNTLLIPDDPTIINYVDNTAEIHLYSFYGDYIAGMYNAPYAALDLKTDSVIVDIRKVFATSSINVGSYKFVVNLHGYVWGSSTDRPVEVNQISPSRDEIELRLSQVGQSVAQFNTFNQLISNITNDQLLNNVVLNFGYNRIYKIVNIQYNPQDPSLFYVKLHTPVEDQIDVNASAWFNFELSDPYCDTVTVTRPITQVQPITIGQPNFYLDSDLSDSNATDMLTWNQLLDTNYPTSQRIIDTAISASGTATINIDYTDFNNFIFYSSAKERIENFVYKLQMLEQYSASNADLIQVSGSSNLYVQQSISANNVRSEQITTNFDSFERWLYYHSTSSLFTHDISGSITPWPKYMYDGKWQLYKVSSNSGSSWYNTVAASASAYDSVNMNRLYWTIPEHILMQPDNSQYILFVEMIAQHFDNIYSYVKALTDIHKRDEHPERGISNDLLYHAARSFGWKLQDVRQLSALWLYKLGTDNSGSYANTGSLFSLPHQQQTSQVWRRIYNNLPYLLKTKGTARSIKALMSIYGIPQTLLSIKEYGGPSVAANKPAIIEDRFFYQAKMTGSNYIELPRYQVPPSSGSWSGISRVPDTVEFRFRTDYSSSVSMSLWAIEDGLDRSLVNGNLELYHITASTATASYSGSTAYGYLKFTGTEISGSTRITSSVTSPYLPLFDNDNWTVRAWTETPLSVSNVSGSIKFQVARTKDCLGGRTLDSTTFEWTGSGYNMAYGWGATTASSVTPHYAILGGTTGSNSNRFIGYMDGYKEYFEVYDDNVFNEHVLNPGAYHVDNVTGSFYSLYRYFPLGLDVQRWDHTTYTEVSSSHPNRKANFATTASFVNWSGTQQDQYTPLRETYYVYVPSLGGNVLRSNKVRIESTKLLRSLSPNSTSVRSQYDDKGFDSNRLAIVFAPSDHVNRDIFNHMGFDELDDWIGDPQYEFDNEYSDLRRFNHEYWQKYTQKNDINALIRILSLYDYTFFEQIKQLVPGRADLISGILIEPHVLERNKVRLTKKPTVTNPQYEQAIQYPVTQSGEYLTYETQLSGSFTPQVTYQYVKTTLSSSFDTTMTYTYYTASIVQPINTSGDQPQIYTASIDVKPDLHMESLHNCIPTSSDQCVCSDADYDYTQKFTGHCAAITVINIAYSGSASTTSSLVVNEDIDNTGTYFKVIYHYSASGNYNSKYEREWYSKVSESLHLYSSRSLAPIKYQIEEDGSRNTSRFIGSKISSADFNIDSSQTIDGGPVIEIFESNPNNIFISEDGDEGNLKVE